MCNRLRTIVSRSRLNELATAVLIIWMSRMALPASGPKIVINTVMWRSASARASWSDQSITHSGPRAGGTPSTSAWRGVIAIAHGVPIMLILWDFLGLWASAMGLATTTSTTVRVQQLRATLARVANVRVRDRYANIRHTIGQ